MDDDAFILRVRINEYVFHLFIGNQIEWSSSSLIVRADDDKTKEKKEMMKQME